MVSIDRPLVTASPTILRKAGAVKPQKSVRFDMPAPLSPMSVEAEVSSNQRTSTLNVQDVGIIVKQIGTALRNKLEGDSSLYLIIIDILSRRPPQSGCLPSSSLVYWLRAFSQIVSSLTPTFHDMVDAILSLDWVSCEDETVAVYGHLIQNLVSAHAVYVAPVTRMLVRNLREGGNSSIAPSLHFDRVHNMLRSVLALIPTGPSFMLSIITENFPHKREALDVHVYYLRNVLRIVEYAPVLRDQVLALIIDRIVQIDVEIQVELDDLDDDLWEEVQRTVFTTETDNPDSVWSKAQTGMATDANGDEDEDDLDFGSDDEEEISPIAVDFKQVVEKLDAMLRLVFQYIQDFAAQNPGDPLRGFV
ncbi:rDNA-binding RNA polymerase I transcriptional factor [Spizellomyces punctatus DAOM BR117]|uniref:Uncharacterized protein n=1 Tax=Spizellomyces punctatus (strain DAOM BR117) TaxID=645134 RepID=A0A0L0HK82_SPIPD|nr:rDNA-binding RNA polymerase I transcriptional factor [Spizellomyces punctatus DAOM BR117]KND01300.1 hypothetical protein SPPG_09087 [Spizellomyces punctatus DAOM BR117]|eukprot:XP_016609339.1 hypothetical protein SPPG_09087 [Spizellomyces punctatus DAOM BR117]